MRRLREFVETDLLMTRWATRHLDPLAQRILCAPTLLVLKVVEFLLAENA